MALRRFNREVSPVMKWLIKERLLLDLLALYFGGEVELLEVKR